MLSALLSTDVSAVSAILCSHPRLGEKKVESEQSRKEQAQLNTAGSGGGGEREKEELARLNGEYEERFPGLRYVYVWGFFSQNLCSLGK